MTALIVILLSTLFPSNINKETEPFYHNKKDKVFFVDQINNPPIIDGILNDDCWRNLNHSNGNYIDSFTQDYPNNLSGPTFRTLVSIGSDSKYIYIGARLFDSNPDSIMQRLSRRDDINPWLSDWFSIEFDSNHDHESAYRFAVNASGVQLDGMIYNDSEFDIEYNAVWESSVQIDEYGWKLEIKIPFNMLSITQLENPWGLNISRFIFRYNEIDRWVVFKEGTPGKVSQFGHIMGFKEVDIRQSIEFKPYLLSGHDRYYNSFLVDPERIFDDHYDNHADSINSNIGLDVKYRISESSSLDLTINPDFGQIEMDPEYINLTYYEIELPEKRSFFNETESVFDTPISIFYSRRVGESSNVGEMEYRINAALKFMGDSKEGLAYTTILAETAPRSGEYSIYQKRYSINRMTKKIFGGKSKIGLSHTYFSFNSDNQDNIIEQSYSIDQITHLLSNQIFIDYQLALSMNHNCIENCNEPNYSGIGYALSMGYNSSFPISFVIDIENYDRNFNINRVGYLARNNIKKYQLNIGYRILLSSYFIREVKFNLIRSKSKNYDNLEIGDRIGFESIIESENYSYIRFSHYIDKEHQNDYLTYDRELNKIGLPFSMPSSTQSAIKFFSDRRKDISFNMGFEYKESEIHQNNIFGSDDNYIGFDFELNGIINFMSIRSIKFYYETKKTNQAYGFVELLELDDDIHNIFSNTDGWINRYSLTLEEYFSNKISLQIYCEYLQHFKEYSNFTELEDGNDLPQVTNLITGGTFNGITFPSVYTDGIMDTPEEEDGWLVQDLNPNYSVWFYPRYTNFNLNFSFKWEYSPSSDIYVIYKLRKSVNGRIFPTINDFLMHNSDDIWSERYFDASFYIKFNYWFSI